MAINKIVRKKVQPLKADSNSIVYTNEDTGTTYSDINTLISSLEISSEEIGIAIDKNNQYTSVGFGITELNHCCGVLEIGAIIISTNFDIDTLTTILDGIVKKVNSGKTIIINTNGKNGCVLFEKALAKCKYFTLVKSFVNSNSKNTIKMWISNN